LIEEVAMPTITFDTLSYAKKLKSAGFTEEQAEIQAQTLKEILGTELATKKDLAETKVEIIKWVAGMLLAQVAIAAALVKLL
jgi:hypothetical protein